jgi:hypothetical protein
MKENADHKIWKPLVIGLLKFTVAGIGVLIVLLVAIFVLLSVYTQIPKPMKAAALPRELSTFGQTVTSFQHYDLGGFIDSEYLWRIEAPASTIQAIIQQKQMSQTNTVPSAFYDMAVIGWPDSLPANAEAFQSRGFLGDARGQDGMHYFLLHDKQKGQAYVWVKNNF